MLFEFVILGDPVSLKGIHCTSHVSIVLLDLLILMIFHCFDVPIAVGV